jgi:hypothetical protein
MALQPFRQASFAGGQLATRLHGRHDLARYFIGLRRSRNGFPVPEGAWMNRAGTLQVREAKDSAAAVDRVARFIPFIFSEVFGQAYVLEFGQGYIRFHVGGATIADPFIPANPYEVATPYLAADLWKLKYAQQGDVVTLTCQGYDTRELKRVAHDNWTIGLADFDIPQTSGIVYVHPSILDNVADATHPAKAWEWLFSELWEDQRGVMWETAPKKITQIAVQDGDPWFSKFTYPAGAFVIKGAQLWRSLQAGNLNHDPDLETPGGPYVYWTPDTVMQNPPPVRTNALPLEVVLFPDKTVKLWVRGTAGLVIQPENILRGRRVYRGRNKASGYVGEFDGTSFLDTGDLPDISLSAPQGRNPFKVYDNDNVLLRTEKPTAVTYQDERRVFLGTAERPATAFLSRVADYYNFDRHSPELADDGFELELAGRLRETIRWAVGAARLLIGTQSSIWALGSPQGTVLTPTSREAKVQGAAGASWLDPLVIPPDVVLYVRTKGTGVRDLVYDGGREGYVGSDLVLFARDLFTGYEIKAWAYAEDPWSVVWAVRSDGKLLSLTYVREQEVWAWAWHDTQGLVEDVCVVPEGGEDAVYLLVKRQKGDGTWHRYVERMASRVVQIDPVDGRKKIEECIFLDSAVTKRPLAAGAAVTGLGHLEGLEVVALADGKVIRTDPNGADLVVTGGQVTLLDEEGDGFDVVHVGLPYLAELELLDLALQGANVRNQVKTVSRVSFELEASRGLEVAEAADAAEADWAVWDVVADQESGLFSGLAEVVAFSGWNKKGRAALRQREPLPCTVLAVTREADVGGA